MARKHKGRRHAKHQANSRYAAGNCPLGKLEVVHPGYGFVSTDEGTFYVRTRYMGGAMNGDTVEVRPRRTEGADKRRQREAAVVRVHRRATEYLVGTLEVNDPLNVVVPQDPTITHDLFVTRDECPQAKDGDVVLARITSYPERHVAMCGYVVEVLGRADAPGMDVDVLIHNTGLVTEFSPQALEQARGMRLDIEAALGEPGVRDLRMRDVFTIDPADAKDFDDAISLDRVDGLLRLGVHIADVSSYVPWDSSIDICARDRGTSTYLVDRVIPMLPEELSNDLCSLKPGEDRRTYTCDLFYDEAGTLRRYQLYPSVIRSRRRFTYDEVQEILDATAQGEAAGAANDPYAPKLGEFRVLAAQLLRAREKRGALGFDSVEAKPLLDDEGHVTSVELHVKTEATGMIEEAMIAANCAVAQHMCKHKLPLVYRIHEAPRPAAVETLVPVLHQLGYPVAGLASGEPAVYQQLLRKAQGRPEQSLVNQAVLRGMERARYSTQPLPHFGLAAEHYCHFTSPIRRYPDLMVHRLLKDAHAMEGQLDWLAEHASKMERLAERVERDSVNLKLCAYLAEHADEVFEATISNVVAYGFYVRLDNTAEGFVRFDPVRDEYHQFDPKLQTLVGEETGRTYRLGQRVRVRVREVDTRALTTDFSLV